MVDFIVIALVVGLMAYTLYRYVRRQKSGGGCDCSGSVDAPCKDYCGCDPEKQE